MSEAGDRTANICTRHGAGVEVRHEGEKCPVCASGVGLRFDPNQCSAIALASVKVGMTVINATLACGGQMGLRVMVPPGLESIGVQAQQILQNILDELQTQLSGERRVIVPPFTRPA